MSSSAVGAYSAFHFIAFYTVQSGVWKPVVTHQTSWLEAQVYVVCNQRVSQLRVLHRHISITTSNLLSCCCKSSDMYNRVRHNEHIGYRC